MRCSSRCVIKRELSVYEKLYLSSILYVLDRAIVDLIPSRSRSCQHIDRGDNDSVVGVYLERHSSSYYYLTSSLHHFSCINIVATFLGKEGAAFVHPC